MHKVKCFICNEYFDRDTVPNIKIGRRYAHKTCQESENPTKVKDMQDREQFFKCIKNIYGEKYNYQLINKQATDYIAIYNYTWNGMTKSLEWFYNIQHGSIEDSNGGIGIIPFIYEEAKEYYKNLYIAQKKNKEIKLLRPVVEIKVQSPRGWRRPPQMFDWEDDE